MKKKDTEKIQAEGKDSNGANEIGSRFSVLIHQFHAGEGITAWDYFNALDLQVKGPLERAYLELCDLVNELPKQERKTADDYLSIQRSAFMLWEQMDKKIMEDYQARATK